MFNEVTRVRNNIFLSEKIRSIHPIGFTLTSLLPEQKTYCKSIDDCMFFNTIFVKKRLIFFNVERFFLFFFERFETKKVTKFRIKKKYLIFR